MEEGRHNSQSNAPTDSLSRTRSSLRGPDSRTRVIREPTPRCAERLWPAVFPPYLSPQRDHSDTAEELVQQW